LAETPVQRFPPNLNLGNLCTGKAKQSSARH
jgi:hypothetical protein